MNIPLAAYVCFPLPSCPCLVEQIQLRTTQNVGIDFEVAGIGDRAIAAALDYLILYGTVILGAVVNALTLESTVVYILLALPLLLYFLVSEIFFDGQSIGKRARGIKVARLDGTAPSVSNYLMRWLLRGVDIDFLFVLYGLFPAPGLITMLINGRGQRLGDLAAGTTVVRVRPRVTLDDTLYRDPTRAAHEVLFPQAEALSPDEFALVQDAFDGLVGEGKSRTGYELGRTIKPALERRLGVETDLPPLDFLRAVVHDYKTLQQRL